jgi:hypothetical protein
VKMLGKDGWTEATIAPSLFELSIAVSDFISTTETVRIYGPHIK